jgi:hypothetical protein
LWLSINGGGGGDAILYLYISASVF